VTVPDQLGILPALMGCASKRHRAFIGAALAGFAATSALAIDTDRADVQAYIKDLAKTQGFEEHALVETLRSASSQKSILEAMSRPAERTKTWKEYRAIFITPERVDLGVSFYREHEARLRRISRITGVPAEIIAAIIGVETYFGRRTGSYRVLDALATLAFDYPPRTKFFQGELTQLLLLAREEKLDLSKLAGSYAGAIGAPQFMPSSYRRYAVDGDGDHRRDLFSDWDDVFASVANYFVANQWRNGQPVAARASTATPIDLKTIENKLTPAESVAGLAKKGVRFSTDLGPDAPAGLIGLDGEDGPECWVAFHNFFVITRYNRSAMYAMAVYQLGQSIDEAIQSRPGGPVRATGN
jgi:membrane-bound lytic murein transglycosylase B